MQPPLPLVLFDGDCALCNGSVRWLLRRDRRRRLHFAPLQSELGRAALGRHELPDDASTMVFIDEAETHVRSDAVLRIAALLPWPWRAAAVLRVVPRVVRDVPYRLIARNRLRLFGRADACELPSSFTEEQRRRILA